MEKILIPNGQLPPSYALACQLIKDHYKVYFTVDDKQVEFIDSDKVSSFKGIKQPKLSWLLSEQTEESEQEDIHYVHTIIRVCKDNDIAIVFPTNDIDIYILSKYKSKFMEYGLSLCCTEHKTLLNFLDKYGSPKLAERCQIKTPKTILYHDGLLWEEACKELGETIIVKARYSQSSAYVWKVKTEKEYYLYVKRLRCLNRVVVLQRYIKGSEEYSYHYLIDSNNEVIFGFKNYKPRHFQASWSTSCEILKNDEFYTLGKEFLKNTAGPGFWVIQTKKCSTDNQQYFIETNARFGNNSRILLNMIEGNLVSCALSAYLDNGLQKNTLSVRNSRGGALLEEVLQIFFSKNTNDLIKRETKGLFNQVFDLLCFYAHLPAIDTYVLSLNDDRKYVLDYYRKLIKVMKS